MNKNILFLLILGFIAGGVKGLAQAPSKVSQKSRFNNVQEMLTWIQSPDESYIMVVAHRGYWRSAPENSVLAVKNAVDAGIDMVEIDVRKTKDGHLVVIHDKTLDRTTTGKGRIEDLTLEAIRSVYLKNGVGVKTHYRVPTLLEMMQYVATQNILVNLDKCWEYLPEAYQILKETNTVHQVLFKGNEPLSVLRKKHGTLMDSIQYMPMVWPENYNIYTNNVSEEPVSYVEEFLNDFDPIGFEVIYDTEDSPVVATISSMNAKGVAVWVNTLWPELCGGHYDELAFEDPDAHWGWVVDHGANIIQSDRPVALLNYLKEKGLRN